MNPVLAIVVGVLAWCAAQAAAAQTSPPPTLPSEIAQFYGDVNFVAAFSNRLDRQQIRAAQRRRHLEAAASEVGRRPPDRPAESLSAREQDVERRLVRIEARTLRIDDVAVLGLGWREGAASADLMRVVGQEWSGDLLRVRVEVWPISPEYGDRLIVDYEQRGRRDIEPVPPRHGRAGHSRLEAHRWRRVDGQWMRMDGVVIQMQKRPY